MNRTLNILRILLDDRLWQDGLPSEHSTQATHHARHLSTDEFAQARKALLDKGYDPAAPDAAQIIRTLHASVREKQPQAYQRVITEAIAELVFVEHNGLLPHQLHLPKNAFTAAMTERMADTLVDYMRGSDYYFTLSTRHEGQGPAYQANISPEAAIALRKISEPYLRHFEIEISIAGTDITVSNRYSVCIASPDSQLNKFIFGEIQHGLCKRGYNGAYDAADQELYRIGVLEHDFTSVEHPHTPSWVRGRAEKLVTFEALREVLGEVKQRYPTPQAALTVMQSQRKHAAVNIAKRPQDAYLEVQRAQKQRKKRDVPLAADRAAVRYDFPGYAEADAAVGDIIRELESNGFFVNYENLGGRTGCRAYDIYHNVDAYERNAAPLAGFEYDANPHSPQNKDSCYRSGSLHLRFFPGESPLAYYLKEVVSNAARTNDGLTPYNIARSM